MLLNLQCTYKDTKYANVATHPNHLHFTYNSVSRIDLFTVVCYLLAIYLIYLLSNLPWGKIEMCEVGVCWVEVCSENVRDVDAYEVEVCWVEVCEDDVCDDRMCEVEAWEAKIMKAIQPAVLPVTKRFSIYGVLPLIRPPNVPLD